MFKKLLFFCLLPFVSFGQMAQNFTVTDYSGDQHQLYQDYLNQGSTVVIKIFFTTCPPCQAQAPTYQALYENWGSGQGDVQFFEISNKTWDSNQDVSNYANIYGTEMPGIGDDGGAQNAINQFTTGTYGPFFGTPSYAVISPNGTVNWGLGIFALDDAIAATGANGLGPQPATYNLNVLNRNNQTVDYSNARIFMGSLSDPNYNLDISPYLSNGSFIYPSQEIPEIANPTLEFVDPTIGSQGGSAIDLILIQKHILLTQPFTDPYQILAADINNSNTLSAVDLIEMQKVLLEVFPSYPNKSLYNYYFPDCQNCTKYNLPFDPGEIIQIDIIRVTTGDVN